MTADRRDYSRFSVFLQCQDSSFRPSHAGSLAAMLQWLQDEIEETDEVFGGDPFTYGVEANRPTLQALVQYMVEQHFIAEAMPIEKLFVPLPGASGT
jgi:hypothetical protein